ncbi:hypothetical protein Pth03_65940 [Planotetraspora thailandica]|uniref:Uncharacterized protein n=1 Tax=Planotetraspora thailandica TaxID=487172 RepID=A0A8J3XZU2_9ACTN|nr:hypothetical protein Pth03_65940 [Planotetraspora thailandica]
MNYQGVCGETEDLVEHSYRSWAEVREGVITLAALSYEFHQQAVLASTPNVEEITHLGADHRPLVVITAPWW